MLQLYYRRKIRSRAAGNGRKRHGGAGTVNLSAFSAAWSPSRVIVTGYGGSLSTSSTGAYDSWLDQTGNSRPLKQTTTARPAVATAGPQNRACGDFDGVNDWLSTVTDNILMSAFMSATAGYGIVSFIADTISASANDTTNPYNNQPIWGDIGGFLGAYLRTTNIAQAFNFDGNSDKAESATISTGTAYVLEWWHDSGNVFICVNNGTPVSVASGNSTVTQTLGLGHAYNGSSLFFDGKIFEFALAASVPAARSAIAANFKTWVGA